MSSRHKGAFVYTGAGKKQPADAPPEQRLCSDEAIRIQRCMARNNHKQQRVGGVNKPFGNPVLGVEVLEVFWEE